MPVLTPKWLSCFFLIGTSALTLVCAAAQQQQKLLHNADAAAKTFDKTLVANYRHWRRINPKPVMMDFQAAVRCAGPTLAQAKRTAGSPHFPKYITVYVNKAGANAMRLERAARFPVGTIIVKEKYAMPDDKTPELMTVMTKKPAGYDPVHGDWEYAVMEASGEVQTRGKLAPCQHCHEQKKSQDYVFKGYLPKLFYKSGG